MASDSPLFRAVFFTDKAMGQMGLGKPDADGRARGTVQLFDALVSQNVADKPDDSQSLSQKTKKLLEPLYALGLESDHSITCRVARGPEETFPFSYAFLPDGVIHALMQDVPLGKPDLVNSAALKFRCVTDDERLVAPERCASLIDVDEESISKDTRLANHVGMLRRFCQVVNVSNPQKAYQHLQEMGLPLVLSP